MNAEHMPPSADLRDKYRVLAKLGEGGMACVHLAVARGPLGARKLVVLKSIRAELAGDADTCAMFVAEGRLAAALSHSNVVQTFEVALVGGSPVLVMEYLDGQSLSKIMQSGELPLPIRLHVLREVLHALEYVHDFCDLDGQPLHLVHRDISPPNVFVTYDGQVKVLDFGIAKIMGAPGITETGVIKGKLRYMAPEQFLSSSHVDRRVDLFAVGAMLWEAITRQRFWGGLPEAQVMHSLLNGWIVAPSTVTPDVPPALEQICTKALAPRREDRYASAAAMRADLDRAIDHLGLRVSPRDVGRFMAERFAQPRAKAQSLVRRQLRTEGLPITEAIASFDGGPVTEIALIGDRPSASITATAVSESPSRIAARRTMTSAAVVAGAAVIGLLAFASAHKVSRPVPPAAAAAAVVVPVVAPHDDVPAREEPTSVLVTIEATPAGTKVFLDGTALASNPFNGEVPRDQKQHAVRAEARGYRAQTKNVVFSGPVHLKLDLEPSSPGRAAPSAQAATRVKGSPAAVLAAGSNSCDTPFYVDDEGIKRVKKECVK